MIRDVSYSHNKYMLTCLGTQCSTSVNFQSKNTPICKPKYKVKLSLLYSKKEQSFHPFTAVIVVASLRLFDMALGSSG